MRNEKLQTSQNSVLGRSGYHPHILVVPLTSFLFSFITTRSLSSQSIYLSFYLQMHLFVKRAFIHFFLFLFFNSGERHHAALFLRY